MPTILDLPPAIVRTEMDLLRSDLDQNIPAKTQNNFLIATWNIRAFASLTRKWTATSSDSPKRDLRGLLAIIEILSRFDVIAIQEIKGDLRALRDTMKVLGDRWGFFMTDVNIKGVGNNERFAFIFDRSRVKPSGLASEIVIPPEQIQTATPIGLDQQFVRPPYAVSFLRDKATIILVTLHVLYGSNEAQRLPELQAIASWMADWADRSNKYHHNLLTLGDFNIDRQGSAGYDAFTSTGLHVPNDLINLPRTYSADPNRPNQAKFYDQIAWFQDGARSLIDMDYVKGGNFNFLPYIYNELNMSDRSKSYRLSDHFPLWVEFDIS